MKKNKQHIGKAFALVKEYYLRRPYAMFLCTAISNLRTEGYISDEQAQDCKEIIRTRLNGYPTYGSWVEATHPKVYAKMLAIRHKADKQQNDLGINDPTRQGRIQWLDSLIKEFS